MPLLANVIFSAFEAPYIVLLVLFIVVIPLEGALIWAWNRESRIWKAMLCALGMNLASWWIGSWIAPRLWIASGLVVVDPVEGVGVLDRGPEWHRLARLAFVQAGVLSVLIEIAAVWPVRKIARLRIVITPILVGNLCTYLLLFRVFLAMFGGWSYYDPRHDLWIRPDAPAMEPPCIQEADSAPQASPRAGEIGKTNRLNSL